VETALFGLWVALLPERNSTFKASPNYNSRRCLKNEPRANITTTLRRELPAQDELFMKI